MLARPGKTSDDIDAISRRQFFFACAGIIIPTAAFFLPGISALEARQDGWLTVPVGFVIALPAFAATAGLARRFGRSSLVDVAEAVAGRVAGRALVAIVTFAFFQILVVSIREFTELLTSVVTPETPPEVFMVLILGSVAYLVRKGITVIGRMAEAIIPVTLALVVAITVVAARDIDLTELMPVLARGFRPVVRGALIHSVWAGEGILVSLALTPFVASPRERVTATGAAVATAMGIGTLSSLVATTLVGAAATPSIIFAVYRVARLISIAGVIERAESLVVALWVLAMLVKLGLTSYATAFLLTGVLGLKHYAPLVLPVLIASGSLSLTQFRNVSMLLVHVARSGTTYGMIFTLGIPMLLFALAALLGRRGEEQ